MSYDYPHQPGQAFEVVLPPAFHSMAHRNLYEARGKRTDWVLGDVSHLNDCPGFWSPFSRDTDLELDHVNSMGNSVSNGNVSKG